jgi:hypothetical protein
MNSRLVASAWTLQKQKLFGEFLAGYTSIAAAIQRKWGWVKRWFYFELTAGSALINDNDQVIQGSPLIALNIFANRPTFAIDCLFVEHDIGYVSELDRCTASQYARFTPEQQSRLKYSVNCVDHRSVLANYRSAINGCGPMGLLYWDGLGGDIYPTEELREWLQFHRRHDLLVMASGTAQKRMGRPRLDEILRRSPRPVWLTAPTGPWQWIFAFVTGWEELPKKLSSKGFLLYPSDSPQGRRILDQLGTTYQERIEREQPSLW